MKHLFVVPTRSCDDGLVKRMKEAVDGQASTYRFYSSEDDQSVLAAKRVAEAYGQKKIEFRGRLNEDGCVLPRQLLDISSLVEEKDADVIALVAPPKVAGMYASLLTTRRPFTRDGDIREGDAVHFDYQKEQYERL
ncbi:MAG: hypothetical protein ACLFO2_04510 [Candidatus Woesearchaeota archaeon]